MGGVGDRLQGGPGQMNSRLAVRNRSHRERSQGGWCCQAKATSGPREAESREGPDLAPAPAFVALQRFAAHPAPGLANHERRASAEMTPPRTQPKVAYYLGRPVAMWRAALDRDRRAKDK